MVGKIFLFIVVTLLFQTPPVKVVLFFGDSLTAGYGLSPEEAFPALVEKQLIKQGAPVKVVNAGLSGETSAGGLARIEWILRQPIDIFVLELGGNDGLRGLPLDQTKMEWLLEALAKTDCPMSCPHGRPVVLRYSMKEIEKAFHRI